MGSRPNSTGHVQGFSPVRAVGHFHAEASDTSSNVDIRPYIGGGISFTHTWADDQLGLPAASGVGKAGFRRD
jgi:hypothetical protein